MTVRLPEVVEDVKAQPPRRRVAIGALAVALVFGLGVLIKELAGDLVFGTINQWLLETVGPLFPAIFEVVATYVASVVAAAGLLWFAFSMGYARGLRDPRSLLSQAGAAAIASDNGTADADADVRTKAASAARWLVNSISNTRRFYNRDYNRLEESFGEMRATAKANLLIIQKTGFPIPDFRKFDTTEMLLVEDFAREVLPYLEKDLMAPGAQAALDKSAEINASLAAARDLT